MPAASHEGAKTSEGAKTKKSAPKNTSKTARVLGLLTSPMPGAEAPAPAAGAEAPQPRPSDDRVVEAQINGALEEELLGEIPAAPASASAPEPTSAPERVPVPESTPAPEEVSAPVSAPAPEAAPAPVSAPAPVPERASAPESAPAGEPERAPVVPVSAPVPEPVTRHEEGIVCFNIMRALVEAKTDKYIKMFGLCTCPRCRIDVIALALTNLPAKYVVAEREDAMVPLLSVYESRYNAAVVTQVINACKQVMESPRHGKR